MAELNWTDAQWQRVNDAVTESFSKASVASAFLPTYGPLMGSAEIVRNERLQLSRAQPRTISLDTDHEAVNLKLVNLTVRVELSSEQVADETLSNALLAFRRAANILALEEDRIVFTGYRRGFPREDSEFVANQIGPQKGLADLPARYAIAPRFRIAPALPGPVGQDVVSQVVNAIGNLENNSNPGPFGCVLGDDLFNSVHTPSPALVLPADRIAPQLKGGPLLRSGMMHGSTGIVVSLAANAVDIVVGTSPVAQFLQRLPNAKYLFRVYERFVLRIRDDVANPVASFRIEPTGQAKVVESKRLKALAVQAALIPNAKAILASARARLDNL
jgi:uncharacterized linocin/CFP29 family protein